MNHKIDVVTVAGMFALASLALLAMAQMLLMTTGATCP